MMTRALGVTSALVCAAIWLAGGACSRVRIDPTVCDRPEHCRSGFRCDLATNRCVQGADPGDAGAVDPFDGAAPSPSDARVPDAAACTEPSQCPLANPRCHNGRCVECIEGMDSAHCSAALPICAGNRCVSCTGAAPTACAARDPAAPVCADGKCLACTATAGCDATPARPVCLAATCVSCVMDPMGCRRRAATPVCRMATGECVECNDGRDCTTAIRPICSPDWKCVACASDMACAQRNPLAPACNNGTCVECTADRHCTTAGKPICDTTAKRCLACTSDAQCGRKGGGPGVCMEDGRCASDAESIVVGPGPGTACMPPTPSGALSCPAKGINLGLSAQRRVVVIRGAVGDFTIAPPNPALGRITVVGQDGNVKPPRDVVGISVTAGDVFIRNLTVAGGESADSHGIKVVGAATKLALLAVTVDGNGGTGVIADPGTEVRINRCIIKGNGKGGLQIDGAAFEVANTVVAGNMGAVVPGSTTFYGGVYLKAAAGRAMVFRNNTIVDNAVGGLICAGAYPVKGLLVGNNAVEQILGCTHGAGSVVTMGMLSGFDGARPYHITPTSPCYNAGDPTDFPPDDLDGDSRPQGGRSDCGADEAR